MLLVYLDQGDLARISDGNAEHVELLREAVAEAQAELLVSTAHVLDMAKADDATQSRWRDAVCSLGPVRFALLPGVGDPIDRDGLSSLMAKAQPDVGTMTSVLELRLDAMRARREANQVAPRTMSPARMREVVVAFLDGDVHPMIEAAPEHAAAITTLVDQLHPMLEDLASLGVDRETILANLNPDRARAIQRGDLDEVVHIQRDRDLRRKPRFSDPTDETHLGFARHADIATVDANVHHALQPTFGQAIPVNPRPDGLPRTKLVILKSGNLEAVASALRFFRSDIDASSEGAR